MASKEERCSEVARKEKNLFNSLHMSRSWVDYLAEVLSTKPAEIVQEAVEVLEKHGCHVKKLKSGLSDSTVVLSM